MLMRQEQELSVTVEALEREEPPLRTGKVASFRSVAPVMARLCSSLHHVLLRDLHLYMNVRSFAACM